MKSRKEIRAERRKTSRDERTQREVFIAQKRAAEDAFCDKWQRLYWQLPCAWLTIATGVTVYSLLHDGGAPWKFLVASFFVCVICVFTVFVAIARYVIFVGKRHEAEFDAKWPEQSLESVIEKQKILSREERRFRTRKKIEMNAFR